MDNAAIQCIAALKSGALCIHPTDTLPGFTFLPDNADARTTLCRLKGREMAKPLIGLVSDVQVALELWEPLPLAWQVALPEIWPGPISIVWTASPKAPRSLVASDGTIALRCPRLTDSVKWYQNVIAACGGVLPTTSVNLAGQPPLSESAQIEAFLKEVDVPVSIAPTLVAAVSVMPSTVIRITNDQADKPSYDVLRQGAMPKEVVDRALNIIRRSDHQQ